MYTAIARTQNINMKASSLLLETTSTDKRSYQYNKFLQFIVMNTTSTMYTEVPIISSLHYSCLLNEFSDIITTQVLAVGIPHAEAAT